MRPVNRHNPAVEISDALKPKEGVGLLTLCAVKVSDGTIGPFDVYNVNRPAAPRQSDGIIGALYLPQLCEIRILELTKARWTCRPRLDI